MKGKHTERKKKGNVTGNASELRRRAEELLVEKMPGWKRAELADEMVHELQVHQIELELQNQELLRAQVEADEAREKYFDLYDMAPVAYLTINRNSNILEINMTGARLLGKLRSALVGNSFTFFIYREDAPVFAGFLERIFSKGDRETCEIRLDRDGTPGPLVRVDGAFKEGREGGEPQCRIIAMDITALREAEKTVQRMLDEKELILKEVHHRVKNNMMIVSSILSLQSQYIDDPRSKKILEECRDRVNSMQIIYDKLYRSEDLQHVNVRAFLTDLAASLFSTYSVETEKIVLDMDIRDMVMDTKSVVTLGIIINEVVTNSIKYAFPGERKGTIDITLSAEEGQNGLPGLVALNISDDGIGVHSGFEPEKATTFGMTLINILVKQLNGSLDVTGANGTCYTIKFTPLP